ncbi:8598_t:CDS:1 [Funneliformis caledonium]|uniref:8598_t:CDS:1 n=1 Tax=Funneliformis caledonium TaxID=1117310 RepID=A0A9N9DG72_9GLOM|nr:8598_t:CDS:1 [Funneliformis caledonium]
MPRHLPTDCLNDIFEHLENKDLRTCLLVNSLWNVISVRILWRTIQNFNTLIACLPNDSKEILQANEIIISTSRPPLFNYITFINCLSVNDVGEAIENFLGYRQLITPQWVDKNKIMVMTREIFKMLMNQISLKSLSFYSGSVSISTHPGSVECLRNLSEFTCSSNISSEFFHQLSRICHNLQSLKITFEKSISNGLTDLITVQKNLRHFDVLKKYFDEDLDLTRSLTKLPNTLTKLHIDGCYLPLSTIIRKLTNLQELVLSCDNEDFEGIQHLELPHLQILEFKRKYPNSKYLIKFLEKNGKNLKVIDLGKLGNGSLHFTISKFCPNLKSLITMINRLEPLKDVLNNCQQLESIDIFCGYHGSLSERLLLKTIVDCSPERFHELKLDFGHYIFPEPPSHWGLMSIFERWANRVPCIPLSLTIITNLYDSEVDVEVNEIIEKYKKLGVIKECKINNVYFVRSGCH